MLKLFKYHFKSFLKMHAIFSGVLIVSAASLLVLAQFNFDDSQLGRVFELIESIFSSVFGLMQIGLFILTFVSSIALYKRKVLGDEGYLTNTLPVKKISILTSFYLNAFVYLIIDVVIVGAATLIVNRELPDVSVLGEDGLTLGLLVVLFLAAYFTFLTHIKLAITFGYSRSTNKVGSSILAGVVLYFLNQIIMGVILVIYFMGITNNESYMGDNLGDTFINLINNLLLFSSVVYLFLFAISYTLTYVIYRKRLNLE